MKDYPEIHPPIITKLPEGEAFFKPFYRDPVSFARRWALPGTPGLEHRVGGLEKNPDGVLSSDPVNHEKMVHDRAEKVARIANYIPDLDVIGDKDGDVLVVGWGGTYGHLYTAVRKMNAEGKKVALAHFDYINPLPKNTAEVFSHFKKIIVCELNLGQFAGYLRTRLPQFEYLQFNKVQGQPFIVKDVCDAVDNIL